MPQVFLIDASIYIHRAWCTVSPTVADREGRPANALTGFADFLIRLLRHERPSHIMAAFDESGCFRHRLHPGYKTNRPAKDPELLRQIVSCRELASALGLCCLSSSEYEADDLIGTVARHYRNKGFVCHFISRDKDLAQLVRPGDFWWGGRNGERIDYEGVRHKFGVYPEQIADYLALVGDGADAIPGVPGIGKAGATRLLAEHRNAEEVIRSGRLDGDEVEILRRAMKLTRIVCEVPLEEESLSRCRREPVDEISLQRLAHQTSNPESSLRRWRQAAAR